MTLLGRSCWRGQQVREAKLQRQWPRQCTQSVLYMSNRIQLSKCRFAVHASEMEVPQVGSLWHGGTVDVRHAGM